MIIFWFAFEIYYLLLWFIFDDNRWFARRGIVFFIIRYFTLFGVTRAQCFRFVWSLFEQVIQLNDVLAFSLVLIHIAVTFCVTSAIFFRKQKKNQIVANIKEETQKQSYAFFLWLIQHTFMVAPCHWLCQFDCYLGCYQNIIANWKVNGSRLRAKAEQWSLQWFENTYVSPATGFSSLRPEIGQENRLYVIGCIEFDQNKKERNCERKPFVNFCFVILILILLKRFFSSFHYLIGVCARDINPDRSITLKMINVFTLGKWNFDAMIYPKTCSLWPKITAVVFLCMLISVHTRDTIFNAIVSNVR